MTLDEPKENEKPQEINGIGVLLDDYDPALMGDFTVDYIKEDNNEGFVIKGGSSCG